MRGRTAPEKRIKEEVDPPLHLCLYFNYKIRQISRTNVNQYQYVVFSLIPEHGIFTLYYLLGSENNDS